MNRKISMIIGSCFVAAMLFGADMETRTATDPNGYQYRYVTNDPVMRLFHTELEAVYEEFNQDQDNDGGLMYEAMLANLFAPHPYSWVPVIGKLEHLKNPSITEITAFLKKYYVPSNMAIALAGDLDFDKTIALVDKYFSWMPSAPAPIF